MPISNERIRALPERTSFIGRARELERLAGALVSGDDRLVTLLGPPGAGKTRLALRFAMHLGPGEHVVCDLIEARSSADVVRIVARALGLRLDEAAGGDDIERIAIALRELDEKPLLVVLDNFEQVVATGPATVGRWLDLAPSVRWLATSRRRLDLVGETCVEVDGLLPDEARTLFLDRARRVAARSNVADAESPDLATLVARLDFMPLALELAASRASALSVGQLLASLARRFEILRTKDRDAVPRHASLRATLDLSWESLDADAQRALAACSVFNGSFTLDAATAVAEASLDALESLHDRSLLRVVTGAVEGERRFAMYESIRDYAAERALDREAVEARHARYYAAYAKTRAPALSGPHANEALTELRAELDQLLAVYRRMRARHPALAAAVALALDGVLAADGPFETHQEILDGGVELAREANLTELLGRLLWARGRTSFMRGLFDLARADFEEGLAARGMSAFFRESAGDFTRARELGDRALALARGSGNVELIGSALQTVAAAAAAAGALDVAASVYEEALDVVRTHGSPRALALTLTTLALARHAQGQFDEARARLLEALALDIGDEALRGRMRFHLATISFDAGRLDDAASLLEEATRCGARAGDREMPAQVAVERARRALLRGEPHAEQLLGEARSAARKIGIRRVDRRLAHAEQLVAASLQTSVRMTEGGYAFSCNGGPEIDLRRRPSLRLILLRIVEAHAQGGAHALSVDELFLAGWPGESIQPKSRAMRVWTAIRTLRRLGLGAALESRDHGYVLGPATRVEIIAAPR
jgi:predicted ATPase